jgi:hypothetical protein
MRDTMHELEETQSSMFQVMEDFPTQSYLSLAFGSMIVSAFFFVIGRRDFAVFIGQWVPSIGIFALMYKLLRPSHERPSQKMQDVAHDIEDVTERTRSRMTG